VKDIKQIPIYHKVFWAVYPSPPYLFIQGNRNDANNNGQNHINQLNMKDLLLI